MRVLVANPGSSTLKLSICDEGQTLSPHTIELHDDPDLLDRALSEWLDSRDGHNADGCGVRVVHGGSSFHAPVRVTNQVVEALRALRDLAPLHMEGTLRTISSIRRVLPNLPVVASFDTAFHHTILPETFRYAVPDSWFCDRGVRKYGFHGLSYAYLAHRLQELAPAAISSRTVALHLGNGASACAIRDGQSINTTMGMTPMDGLVMGTRAGSIDPGILFYLLRTGIPATTIEDDLNHHSGLKGVSGFDSDYRAVDTAAREGNQNARMAIRIAVRRAAESVASLAVSLGGLSCLVFSGGIGEHAPGFREDVCRQLEFLGVLIDPEKNRATTSHGGNHDRTISREDSRVSVWIVEAREDWTISEDVRKILTPSH